MQTEPNTPEPARPLWQAQLPGRPLSGLTVLVVEDSRFASEAMRLLCLRSGARIRRADSLRTAMRHLQTYRPAVVIIDMGLPDGCGTELIAQIRALGNSAPTILAISGDPDMRDTAVQAGAADFLDKPIESLAVFQQAILSSLPAVLETRAVWLLQLHWGQLVYKLAQDLLRLRNVRRIPIIKKPFYALKSVQRLFPAALQGIRYA